IATGHMVWQSLEAARQLRDQGIEAEVIDIHTIKPLDEEAVIRSVRKTGCVVTAEEHQRNGGLGDAVAQTLGRHHPSPQEYVAVDDKFGESGKPLSLLDKYGLSVDDVVATAKRVVQRKSK
ncbi:MAG: transketolase C-terminal domain-containing protein, partial [Saprospiraceae bacterium]|nr:transketolase C-terminal domain-containing protein [Saprospiraceae bacterium]